MKRNVLIILLFLTSLYKSLFAQCTLPVISEQPTSVTACAGGTTSLSVVASGGVTYQWYWSGSSGSGIVPPVSPPWSGNTTNTLTISYLSTSMAGQYWVKVTNACGSVTSNQVSVVVDKLPVNLSSDPKIACEGGAVNLTGAPEAMSTYSWMGPNNFTSNSKTPSISNVTTEMSGTYSLTVTTSNGCSSSGSVNVTVNQILEPSIGILTTNSDWCNEGKTVFEAEINNGGNSPSYQWMVNGVAVANANGTSYTSTLLNNEQVTCMLTSNEVCVTNATVSSNVIKAVHCSTSSMNYVKSRNILKDKVYFGDDIDQLSADEVQETVTYLDGLGRPLQRVSWQSSPLHQDMIQPFEYDNLGREAIKYLPYVAGNNGKYKEGSTKVSDHYVGSQHNLFYNNGIDKIADDLKPYSQAVFEASPLNRVVKQGAPGDVWQPDDIKTYTSVDHTIKKAYGHNIANDVLLWTSVASTTTYPLGLIAAGTSSSTNYYTANQLHISKTKDEHGNEIIEYTDKNGHIILKRVQIIGGTTIINDTNYASTYYIYDDLGSLVCVLSPEAVKRITATPSAYFDQTDAVKEIFLQQWAFRYTYDGRKRMTQKQVPGAAVVYMVYDNRDRLVLTQDGNQRSNKQWTFTKYDELNRPIATGIKDTTAILTQADMQTGVAAHYAKSWARYGETYIGNVAGNISGYSNKSYPVVIVGTTTPFSSYRTITYYDNYAFKSYIGTAYDYLDESLSETANGYTYTQPTAAFSNVMGQVTGTRARVLDDHIASSVVTWLNSVNYYDDKYRV
ncbi:MAG TPA: DUF6443 domain-containing protein, partial [Cyclobacteriaceae bacterium]